MLSDLWDVINTPLLYATPFFALFAGSNSPRSPCWTAPNAASPERNARPGTARRATRGPTPAPTW